MAKNMLALSRVGEAFQEQESQAKKLLSDMDNNLAWIIEQGYKNFVANLEKSDLNQDEQKKANNIFIEYLQKPIQKISSIFSEASKNSKKNGKSIVYNLLLSEKIISLLEAIEQFKANIDELLPISCDKILKYASSAIIGIVKCFSPAVALVLQTTDIINRVVEIFEAENLNSTIKKMKKDLARINQDERLKCVDETIKSVNERVIPAPTLDTIIHNSQKNPIAKEMIENIENSIKKSFTKDMKDVNKDIERIKKSIFEFVDTIKDNDIAKSKAYEIIHEKFAAVTRTIRATDSSAADKLVSQGRVIKTVSSCVKAVTQVVAEHLYDEAYKTFSKKIANKQPKKVISNASTIGQKIRSWEANFNTSVRSKGSHSKTVLNRRKDSSSSQRIK